jgi:hypothetical protein
MENEENNIEEEVEKPEPELSTKRRMLWIKTLMLVAFITVLALVAFWYFYSV